MATKIDLLPSYVGMRRWFRRIRWVCLVFVGGLGAVLWLIWFKNDQQLNKLQNDLKIHKRIADKTREAEKKAKAADDEAAPWKTCVDFIWAAQQTGKKRANMIRLIKGYIYPWALVSSIDISDGETCKLSVAVARPEDYYNFLIDLRRGWVGNPSTGNSPTAIFADEPKASGIPGFPSPIESSVQEQIAMPTSGPSTPITPKLAITATAKLRDPMKPPTEAGGAGAPAAAPGAPPGPGK